MNLSVSVVIFNTLEKDLEALFSSYSRSIKFAKENGTIKKSHLFVVDNSITSKQKNLVDKLCTTNALEYSYIQSEVNGGYGFGHNQAIHLAKSDFHLVSNPDIEFYEETISNAVKFLVSSPKTVLLTPAVFGVDGERHYLCKRNPTLLHLFLRRFCATFIKNYLFKDYLEKFEYRDCSYNKVIKNVPFCTGCFMFFSTSVLKELNGFDDRFFMYMEDADISRRALLKGETAYVPSVKIVHRWERGAYNNVALRNTAIKSAFKYFWKWGGVF